MTIFAFRVVTLSFLKECETKRFFAESGNFRSFTNQSVAILVFGHDVSVFVGGAPGWAAVGVTFNTGERASASSSPATTSSASASSTASVSSNVCVKGLGRRRLATVLLEMQKKLGELVAAVEVEILKGCLVVIAAIGVRQEPSLEVGDQINCFDVFGAHLGVDLVGDLDQLCGVLVDIFMIENVSGPESGEKGGPVNV